MNTLPTAEEFLLDAGFPGHAKHGLAKKWMIEFAKLHVEAAIENILNDTIFGDFKDNDEYIRCVDSIINAYPLTNIK